MDNYTEQIINAKPGMKQFILFAAAIMLTAFGIIAALFISFSTGAICVILGGIAIYFTKLNMSFEYEYIFTNGDFEIAKIIAKSTRKNVCEIHDGDIKRILPFSSEKFQNEMDVNADLTIKDFTSGNEENADDCFAFISNNNGKDLAVILELNDKNKDYLKSVYKTKLES
ncbi:MAG: hypothetical protein IJT72_05025 [Lachnospiraceae bacterium]|nr:hypothetical protein [Lachnospiraceae bacterium]